MKYERSNMKPYVKLRKALIEQQIVLTNSPLDEMIAAAKNGRQDELVDRIAEFRAYASRLGELSRLACALVAVASSSGFVSDGVRMVQVARKNVEALVPYVINAAQVLCDVGGESHEAIENMLVIRSRWISQVDLLQLAIDDITSISDFMGRWPCLPYRSIQSD